MARSSGPTGARGPPPAPPSVAPAPRARKSSQASHAGRRRPGAEGHHRHPGLQLAQPGQHVRRPDQEQPGAAGRQDLVQLGGRAGGVERHAHGTGQADGHVHGQVAGAVHADQRHPVAGLDAEARERGGRREHLAAHGAPVASHGRRAGDVLVGHRPAPGGQAEQELLVDGPAAAVQEPLGGGVGQQAREIRPPVGLVGAEQPVGVVAAEAAPLGQVGQQGGELAAPPTRWPQRDEQRPRQAHVELVGGPAADQAEQLVGPGQRLQRGGQVDGPPGRGRVEGQAHDGVGHPVHRDDVDPQARPGGHDAQAASEVPPQRDIDAVERLDRAGAGVADDHGRAHDGDRQLGPSRPDQALTLVLAVLVGVGEAPPVGQVVLVDRAGPPAGHVGGGHVEQAGQARGRGGRRGPAPARWPRRPRWCGAPRPAGRSGAGRRRRGRCG